MDYDTFVQKAKRYGVNTEEVLPRFFSDFFDEMLYTTKMIEDITGKSQETARRWFVNGHIKAESTRPWKAYGIDVKRYLFKVHVNDNTIKKLPELFS
jgi:hypothetical protein